MWVHLAASFESLQQLSEDSVARKYSALGEPLFETLFVVFKPYIYIFFFFESAWGLLNLCICVVLVCSIHVPAGIFLWLFFLLQIIFVNNMFVVYGKNACKQWQGPVSDFLTFLETYSPNCSNVGLWMMYYHCHPQAKSWSAILLCQDLYIKDIC